MASGGVLLLDVRKSHTSFHPFGGQEILTLHPAVFALLRTSPDASERILGLQNISDQDLTLSLDLNLLPFKRADSVLNILNQKRIPVSEDTLHLNLAPYEVLWLEI